MKNLERLKFHKQAQDWSLPIGMSDDTNLNRLDSISRRTTPVSNEPNASKKSGLKFKPKLVARRTKEERDKSAPVVVESQDPMRRKTRGTVTRGRGRGRGASAGTHMVVAGPLSHGVQGHVGGDPLSRTKSTTVSSSAASTSEAFKKLHGKSGSDEEFEVDDMTVIDVNTKFELNEDTDLFPVRASRVEHQENGEADVKTETDPNSHPESTTTSRDVSLKPEPLSDDETGTIAAAPLEIKEQSPTAEPVTSLDPLQEKEEKSKLTKDYEHIKQLVEQMNVSKDDDGDVSMEPQSSPKSLFFQLPNTLPTFEGASSEIHNLNGIIGSLRVHKSGRTTVKIGNIIMDVAEGGRSPVFQELIAINHEKKEIYNLGSVENKLIVTPSI
ncbi:BA75_00610T0 [Komagataella pastoris]|uniref:BA75_00610T0 n=1 Tax=Komagataella pastoris TaxID=4922 RepID=A0A1B2JA22_PICPA|nr:BA75_00610T0 [Komagataella pastoris]